MRAGDVTPLIIQGPSARRCDAETGRSSASAAQVACHLIPAERLQGHSCEFEAVSRRCNSERGSGGWSRGERGGFGQPFFRGRARDGGRDRRWDCRGHGSPRLDSLAKTGSGCDFRGRGALGESLHSLGFLYGVQDRRRLPLTEEEIAGSDFCGSAFVSRCPASRSPRETTESVSPSHAASPG